MAVAQVLAAHATLKVAHLPFLRESRALLSDLESQVTTDTERFEASRRAWRRRCIALAFLGLAALIGLALKAVDFFG